jgi:ATP-dependent Clp protease protease subunit
VRATRNAHGARADRARAVSGARRETSTVFRFGHIRHREFPLLRGALVVNRPGDGRGFQPERGTNSASTHRLTDRPLFFRSYDIRAQQGKGPPPMVMERFQGVASQLMNQRIIRLGGAVDDDSCNLIVAQLLWLDAMDPKKDITIYVNSPGGSVTAGMAVFDTMRHVRPDVSTVCVGLAASMGAFLLSAGQQGKRYSMPNSRIMIHQPLGGAQGQAADIEIQANEIMHHKSTLNGYIAEFCGKPLDVVMEDTDRDFFMSAADAKEYGLVDHVIDNPTEIAARASGIPMYAGDNL